MFESSSASSLVLLLWFSIRPLSNFLFGYISYSISMKILQSVDVSMRKMAWNCYMQCCAIKAWELRVHLFIRFISSDIQTFSRFEMFIVGILDKIDYKNKLTIRITRHAMHTIVSWPNSKQWLMIHISHFLVIRYHTSSRQLSKTWHIVCSQPVACWNLSLWDTTICHLGDYSALCRHRLIDACIIQW